MTETNLATMPRADVFDALDALDPHYAGLLRAFHATLDDVVGLPPRLARLCNLGAAVVLRAPGLTREYLAAAREAGATPEECAEVVFSSHNFAGFAALAEGLAAFREVLGESAFKGQDPAEYPVGPKLDGYDKPSLDVGVAMYGPVRARSNIDMFRAVGGPRFAEALELQAYGGLFARRVLPPLDREIITVALLSAIERPGPFTWHAKAALRFGAKALDLRQAVLGQATIAGVVVMFRSMALLGPVIDDWRAHPQSDGGL